LARFAAIARSHVSGVMRWLRERQVLVEGAGDGLL
jgi:hypothetical protein